VPGQICAGPVSRKMTKTKKHEKAIEKCKVCGAPYVLVQSLDALFHARAGSGFGAYKQTCKCWFCSGCMRRGRENEPHCDCVPCPLL
jgi:hypothetical protein